MRVYVRCHCGDILTVDPQQDGGQALCPKCGRRCAAPPSAETSANGQSRLHWTPPAWAFVCLLALCAALMWAMATPGQGSGDHGDGDGAGLSGNDPYEGRRIRGVGDGDEGEGSGGGEGGVGMGVAEAGEGSDGQAEEDEGGGGEDEGPAPPRPPPVDLTRIPDIEDEDGPLLAGAGAAYQKRGNQSYARKMGATKESEAAVDRGLAWLARVQCDDGHWCERASDGMPPAQRALASGRGNSAGYTGLATLAFLGAGKTHKDKGPHRENVQKALDWLVKLQKPNGACMSSGNFYEQGIATTALCEAYGMTKDPALKEPAQKAVDFILDNMTKQAGFGYGGPGDDTHVTSFQVMAIKSAKLAGLQVGAGPFERLRDYYDRALRPDYTTGYRSTGGHVTEARTALGLFCRLFLDLGRKELKVQKIAELLDRRGPLLNDVFQTYYGTYGMFQMGDDYWTKWNKRFRDPTVKLQIAQGTDHGAWQDGVGRVSCPMVLATALRIMSLEVYYRFLPVNK